MYGSVIVPSSLIRSSCGNIVVSGVPEKTTLTVSPTWKRNSRSRPFTLVSPVAPVAAGVVAATGWSASLEAKTGSSLAQPLNNHAASTRPQPTNSPRPENFRSNFIRVSFSDSPSVFSFDFRLALVAGGLVGAGRRLHLLVLGIVVVVVAAVVIVALVLGHVDVVEDDADQVATDLFDELFGADVHRLRVAAVLDDLEGDVHFAGQDGGVAHAHNRRRVEEHKVVALLEVVDE